MVDEFRRDNRSGRRRGSVCASEVLPDGLDRLAHQSKPEGVAETVAVALADCVSPAAATFDGDSVLETCERRGDLMVRTLLRGMP